MRYFQHNEHPVSDSFAHNPYIIDDPYYKKCIEEVAVEYLKEVIEVPSGVELSLLRLRAMQKYFKGNDLGFDVYNKMKIIDPNIRIILRDISENNWKYLVVKD